APASRRSRHGSTCRSCSVHSSNLSRARSPGHRSALRDLNLWATGSNPVSASDRRNCKPHLDTSPPRRPDLSCEPQLRGECPRTFNWTRHLRRVQAHAGSLDLVCTQQRILKILKITGLTEVFGIYETVDQAIAAAKGRR